MSPLKYTKWALNFVGQFLYIFSPFKRFSYFMEQLQFGMRTDRDHEKRSRMMFIFGVAIFFALYELRLFLVASDAEDERSVLVLYDVIAYFRLPLLAKLEFSLSAGPLIGYSYIFHKHLHTNWAMHILLGILTGRRTRFVLQKQSNVNKVVQDVKLVFRFFNLVILGASKTVRCS